MKTDQELEHKLTEKTDKANRLARKKYPKGVSHVQKEIDVEQYKKLENQIDTLKWVLGYYGPRDLLDF